jgi:predicted permease
VDIIIVKVLPLILIFLAAFGLKKAKIFSEQDGERILKLNFYIAVPALIFVSLQTLPINPKYFVLPIIPLIIISTLTSVAFLLSKKLSLSRPTLGTFLVGSAIINTGFTFPFLYSVYGPEAILPASFFDLGGMFMTFGFIYFLACRYGQKGSDINYAIKKILSSPPLWAIILGIVFNLLHIPVHESITNAMNLLGQLVIPSAMLAVGFYFHLEGGQWKLVTLTIFIRMALGVCVGIILSKLFGLTGFIQHMVIILSASPIGYNTITFASLENLDVKLAAKMLSVSTLIGMLLIPILIYFLH